MLIKIDLYTNILKFVTITVTSKMFFWLILFYNKMYSLPSKIEYGKQTLWAFLLPRRAKIIKHRYFSISTTIFPKCLPSPKY
jgi:hypothetical protein